jgi:hypothetical protein
VVVVVAGSLHVNCALQEHFQTWKDHSNAPSVLQGHTAEWVHLRAPPVLLELTQTGAACHQSHSVHHVQLEAILRLLEALHARSVQLELEHC